MWGRKSKIKLARTAAVKAGHYAYRDRRTHKRSNRALANIKINAAARENGMSYSRLIDDLKKRNIALDRKVMSQLAEHHPTVFAKLVRS
jgi:large subunit ribosomal protein L20